MKVAALFALALALLLAGCGSKGAPRAPELVPPRPIENLSARAEPRGVVLTWRRPMESVDGRTLTDLASFVIFRKEISPACPECPVPYRQLTTVFVEDREKFVKQRQYRFIDAAVQPGSTYRYRVSSQLIDGLLSEPSNEVEVTWSP